MTRNGWINSTLNLLGGKQQSRAVARGWQASLTARSQRHLTFEYLESRRVFEAESVLTPGIPLAYASFGNFIIEDRASSSVFVSAYRDTLGEAGMAGAVYEYDFSDPTPVFARKYFSLDSESGDYFGFNVAVDSSFLAVGAPRFDTEAEDSGAVFLFKRGSTEDPVRANNPLPTVGFGSDIELISNKMVVIDYAGNITLFESSTGQFLGELMSTGVFRQMDVLGDDLFLTNGVRTLYRVSVATGAVEHVYEVPDYGGNKIVAFDAHDEQIIAVMQGLGPTGFLIDATNGDVVRSFSSQVPGANVFSASLGEHFAVIGTYYDEQATPFPQSDYGRADLIDLSSGAVVASFQHPTGGDHFNDHFAASVLLRESQRQVVVGAVYDDASGEVDSGAIYLFPIPSAHIFYNNSKFDGNSPAADVADDNAIDPLKRPLLRGQAATVVNYTSFSKGINGIMIDLPNVGGTITASDFTFKTGNVNDTATWVTLVTAPSVTVRPGAGAGGSDRVTLTWPDGTIRKQWLQVTVKANATTGLAADDVFYFGNAPGEAGNSPTDAQVNAADELAARGNPRNIANPAPVTFLYDYNRDKQVNAADQLISRGNPTNLATRLVLITPMVGAIAPRRAGLADVAMLNDDVGAPIDVLVPPRRRRA